MARPNSLLSFLKVEQGRRSTMRPPRWTTVTASEHRHEARALDFLRAHLPDEEPWRAWSNFTFVRPENGRTAEVDLLVLAPAGMFLVEIKTYLGLIEGDSQSWTITSPNQSKRTEKNPYLAADEKAKWLKSLLESQRAFQRAKRQPPFIQAVVFLEKASSPPRIDAGTARYVFLEGLPGSYGDNGIIGALTGSLGRPGSIDTELVEVTTRAMQEIGFRERIDAGPDGVRITGADIFRFLGKDYSNPAALGDALAGHWEEALDLVQAGPARLRDWLRHGLGRTELATRLAQVEASRASPEVQLFAIIGILAPDRIPIFRNLRLTPRDIVTLADGSAKDRKAGEMLRTLHVAGVLRDAAALPGGKALKPTADAWSEAITGYAALGNRLRDQGVGGLPDLEQDRLILLLAAATPDSNQLKGLRESAAKVSSGLANRCAWFQALGKPGSAPAQSALALTILAPHAEAEVQRLLQAREMRRDRLFAGAFVGGLFGAIIPLLLWALAAQFCSGNPQACRVRDWPFVPLDTFHWLVIAAAVAMLLSLKLLMIVLGSKKV